VLNFQGKIIGCLDFEFKQNKKNRSILRYCVEENDDSEFGMLYSAIHFLQAPGKVLWGLIF
jgi:hypothetical protein